MIPSVDFQQQKICSPFQLHNKSKIRTHSHVQQAFQPKDTIPNCIQVNQELLSKQRLNPVAGQAFNKFPAKTFHPHNNHHVLDKGYQKEIIERNKTQANLQYNYSKINQLLHSPQSPQQKSVNIVFQDEVAGLGNKHNTKGMNQAFQQILQKKQHQIKLLSLELERYKRCESINKQNEQLYQRLVEMLNYEKEKIKIEAAIYESRRAITADQRESKKPKDFPLQTTRFFYPQTVRANHSQTYYPISKHIQSKYCFDSQQNQEKIQDKAKGEDLQQKLMLKNPSNNDSNTMTFNLNKKQKMKKVEHQMRTRKNQKNLSLIYQAKVTYSGARFGEIPINLKLEEINKYLFEKRIEEMGQRLGERKKQQNSAAYEGKRLKRERMRTINETNHSSPIIRF